MSGRGVLFGPIHAGAEAAERFPCAAVAGAAHAGVELRWLHVVMQRRQNVGLANPELPRARPGAVQLSPAAADLEWVKVSAIQDIRLALRLFRRTPVPSAVALLSIALSVGATAIVFAALKSVLLDPLPYARPWELVQLRSEYPKLLQQPHGDWVIWNDVREIPRRTRTLGPLGVFGNAVFDLSGDNGAPPEALYGIRMNAALFHVLGVSPMLGRNVLAEEERPDHGDVIILSYGLWVRRFHSDRSIVGRTVTENGHSCLVIGVMPPGFNFPMRWEAARTPVPYVDFWAAPLRNGRNPQAGMGAVARLLPGVSLKRAREDLASMTESLRRDFPELNRDRALTVNNYRDRTIRGASRGLGLLMAAAVLFMLIGCANVANLLLARGFARQREMAIRLAMGADFGRLLRQLLIESCTLALLGGVAGYALTAIAWRVLPAVTPVSIPRLAAARADTAVFAFALGLAVADGVLFGVAPALRTAGWQSPAAWCGFGVRNGSGSRRDRLRSFLVAGEVALSVLLVTTGAQVALHFARLIGTPVGFRRDGVVASVVLAAPERYRTPEKRAVFYERVVDAVRSLPGVESAGTVDALPFSGENMGGSVSARGAADESALTAEINVTGGEYLQTLGVHLLEGRWFRGEDMSPSGDAAIVDAFVARRLWPDASAIGQRICVSCTPESPDHWKRVVGVVASTRHSALDESEKGNVYLAGAAMQRAQFLVVRTDRPEGEVAAAIRRAIAAIDPAQPVLLSVAMRDLIADSVADRRFIMMLLSITGSLALLMAAGGVYGVVSYTTTRRTQEIGIRIAIGASPRNVISLIMRQGFRPVAAGLAGGVTGTIVCTRILLALAPGMESASSGVIFSATCVVAAAAGVACFMPARRATRTDPVAALRQE